MFMFLWYTYYYSQPITKVDCFISSIISIAWNKPKGPENVHRPTYAIVCFFYFTSVSVHYSKLKSLFFYFILFHLHVTKIVIISFYICIMCWKHKYLFIIIIIFIILNGHPSCFTSVILRELVFPTWYIAVANLAVLYWFYSLASFHNNANA